MTQVEKIIKFLKKKYPTGIQIFYTPNITNDEMEVIWNDGTVTILYAIYYDYIEIFGMKKDDYNRIVDECQGIRHFSSYMVEEDD